MYFEKINKDTNITNSFIKIFNNFIYLPQSSEIKVKTIKENYSKYQTMI